MRRDFLKLCSLAGLGCAAPIGATAKQKEPDPYPGPYFLVFNASGGWDTTYLMDPKGSKEINRMYQASDILNHGAHHFAPTEGKFDKGMSNQAFFKKYGADLLVFNGLDYSVNNHAPCSRYMATGKLDSLAFPTFAALAAACKGPECPLAYLTFGNYSNAGNLVPMARVPYLPSLKLLANADGVHGSTKTMYHDAFVQDHIDRALERQLETKIVRPRLPRLERAESMLYAAQVNSRALKRVTPYIADQVPRERLAQQAEIALASFKAGVAVSANLSIGQFDSHANNDRDQHKLIPEFLAGIDHAVMRAEALGIRDKLIVVMQSEMGRKPYYNKGDGKDHWSIGSIMFMGQGIQGNRVLGRTDEGQKLVPVSAKTLEIAPETGIRVRPEHVHLALRELAGIERHAFSERFPLKVPEGERLAGLWQA